MILFVRGGALGDFVLTLPALAATMASGRPVHVACARRHRALARLCGEPARFWDLDAAESLWMFGGKDPIGFTEAVSFAHARADLPIAVHHHVAARPPAGTLAWSHFAGVLPPEFPTVDPGLVLAAPPLAGPPPIVLAPGASDASRSWPVERWFRLAKRLAVHAPVRVIGGPSEPWATDRPDLDELIRLAASAAVWFGPDSGPTHLAARMGAPTLALFGPTDRAWAPHSAEVLDFGATDEEVLRRVLGMRGARRLPAPAQGSP